MSFPPGSPRCPANEAALRIATATEPFEESLMLFGRLPGLISIGTKTGPRRSRTTCHSTQRDPPVVFSRRVTENWPRIQLIVPVDAVYWQSVTRD
jgi:hypothetical protein